MILMIEVNAVLPWKAIQTSTETTYQRTINLNPNYQLSPYIEKGYILE